MSSPIFSIVSDSGERLLLNWSECSGCHSLVRPGKGYCCAKCEDHPGKHSATRHYRPKDMTNEDALKSKLGENPIISFFGDPFVPTIIPPFIPTTAADIV